MDGTGFRGAFEVRKRGYFYTEVLSDPEDLSQPMLEAMPLSGREIAFKKMTEIGLSWQHALQRQFLNIGPWTAI